MENIFLDKKQTYMYVGITPLEKEEGYKDIKIED